MKILPPSKSLLQFRLSWLMVVVTIASMGFAFVAQQLTRARNVRQAVDEVRKAGGEVFLTERNSLITKVSDLLGEDLGAGVTEVRFQGTESVMRPNLAPLAHFSELKCLTFYNADIRDEDMVHLSELRQIEQLEITGEQLTNAGLRHIEKMTRLVSLLSIDCPRIDDDGLASLSGFHRLIQLDLSRTRISGRGLQYLHGLSSLLALDLSYTQLDDVHVHEVTKFVKLERLELAGTRITSKGLSDLTMLSNIKSLRLDDTKIDDEGLVYIGKFPNLEQLFLCRTSIGDVALAKLRNTTHLQSLDVSGCMISDKGVRRLGCLNNLSYLGLRGTQITDRSIETLATMTMLQEIDLRDTAVTDAGVEALSVALPDCHIRS